MEQAFTKLTVYFDNPFWVGVFERVSDGKLSACKVTFGAEPTERELWAWILKHYDGLTFSPAVDADIRRTPDNPKRAQREARRQTQSVGIGTKSQQALQAQREAMKTERKRVSKEREEAEKRRKFALRREKRKAKHKGR